MVKISKDDQSFVYQLGKDIAKLDDEIDKLKNKSVKAIRIVVPAIPEEYKRYNLKAVINLPPECQNAICIKSKNGEVSLIETTETLSVYPEYEQSEFYLAPIYKLEVETINAAFDQEQMAQIESDVREREEREERERKEREKAEHEKAEQESTYKYLAKFLTDNYLELVRNRTRDRELEAQGIMAYVNKNGLKALLDIPFEKNITDARRDIAVGDYADAKSAMLTEKARIDRGEVDLSVASDFKVVDYSYIKDSL